MVLSSTVVSFCFNALFEMKRYALHFSKKVKNFLPSQQLIKHQHDVLPKSQIALTFCEQRKYLVCCEAFDKEAKLPWDVIPLLLFKKEQLLFHFLKMNSLIIK